MMSTITACWWKTGQEVLKKSVYFLPVVMKKDISELNADQIGREDLTYMQPHKVEDLIGLYTKESAN
jgi:hypothetical protein